MPISIYSPLTRHYCGEAREDLFNVKHKHAGADPAGIYGFCYIGPNQVTVSGTGTLMQGLVKEQPFLKRMGDNQLNWQLEVIDTGEPFRSEPVGFLNITGRNVEELITCSNN